MKYNAAVMARNSFRLCMLAALTALVSACVLGPPMPIPAQDVLATPVQAPQTFAALRGAHQGADGNQLRGRLSAE
jgi:hypothetical protein